jgi:hypothetical protein
MSEGRGSFRLIGLGAHSRPGRPAGVLAVEFEKIIASLHRENRCSMSGRYLGAIRHKLHHSASLAQIIPWLEDCEPLQREMRVLTECASTSTCAIAESAAAPWEETLEKHRQGCAAGSRFLWGTR